MRKKIGFIDYFLDEWHANHLIDWFKTAKRADEFELYMAYGEKMPPFEGRRTNVDWCSQNGVKYAETIDEVVENCDYLCVLAPSNPEVHYRLAEKALMSGKPTYVDKPFAPSLEEAKAIFALAEKYNTRMFSSSSLRFGDGMKTIKQFEFKPSDSALALVKGGGSNFPEYVIHLLEMITSFIGIGAERVIYNGAGKYEHQLMIAYPDKRTAALTMLPCGPFSMVANRGADTVCIDKMEHYFENFVDALFDFFADGIYPVEKEETLAVAALVEAAVEAQKHPQVWIDVPK